MYVASGDLHVGSTVLGRQKPCGFNQLSNQYCEEERGGVNNFTWITHVHVQERLFMYMIAASHHCLGLLTSYIQKDIITSHSVNVPFQRQTRQEWND